MPVFVYVYTGPLRVTFVVRGAVLRRVPRVTRSGALGGATGPYPRGPSGCAGRPHGGTTWQCVGSCAVRTGHETDSERTGVVLSPGTNVLVFEKKGIRARIAVNDSESVRWVFFISTAGTVLLKCVDSNAVRISRLV